jgi:hypothetical protein
LLWPDSPGPVFRNRRVRVEVEKPKKATPYGGLALAHQLVKKLDLDKAIDRDLHLLKIHLPYHESDHILTQVYNLYVGGGCIEDIANLQASKAFQNLVGACRVPDPTTAGDFLRRFGAYELGLFQRVIDEARQTVWRKMPRRFRKRATIDLDSHVKEVYGQCKVGADFSYNGKWSYHPFVATLQETNECLRLINRPGNAASAEGAGEALDECLGLACEVFDEVYVRGDSKFYQESVIELADLRGAGFAIAMEEFPNIRGLAESVPEASWRPYRARSASAKKRKSGKKRRKRKRVRRAKARGRGYRNLRTVNEWIAEVTYSPSWTEKSYRMVIKRKRIETSEGQEVLFEAYHYRYVLTNIGRWSAGRVVEFAYGRCDQENVIEQLRNGIAAMRMPTGELVANSAFMLAAELAWNLRAWVSLLGLGEETLRWEWKRFRQGFVYVAAEVVKHARSAWVRLSGSHRYAGEIARASRRIGSFAFT